ncbi:hypothetical protein [Phenylobacterium sp.]|uniref:hypothetical protein n=1 Tax=Phenylobacterium sp. TaxID=1871053 RepID=UPI003D26E9C1
MRPAAWLSLAAAPTFTVMAAVTAALDARAAVTVCGPAPAPVSGMVVMYVLMSAFHLGPWLQRASR